jgi:hypothetical protein
MNRRTIFIILGVAVLACVVCVVVATVLTGGAIFAVFNTVAKPMTDTANDFMNAVKSNDYVKAYNMVIPEQQASFGGSPDGMKALFQQNNWVDPVDWSFTNFNVQNNEGVVSGNATFKGNVKGNLEINLRNTGNQWKIVGLRVT